MIAVCDKMRRFLKSLSSFCRFQPPELISGAGDRVLDCVALEIMWRGYFRRHNADRVPWAELPRQFLATRVVRKCTQAVVRLGLENIEFHEPSFSGH